MVDTNRADGGPRSAIVVGAGIVGLSTAWFLQERGVSVTVVDRIGVAAGASWGNAGWIAPALSIPLNEPRTLTYGLRSFLNRTAPVRIPLTADPALWRFLMRFAANCRRSSWTRAARASTTLNQGCLEAYDMLVSNGVQAPITDAPITAVFRTSQQAEHLLDGLQRMRDAGQPISTTELTGAALRGRLHQWSAFRRPRTVRAGAGTFRRRKGRAAAHRGRR
jgi:D-amino-acid dehydrogenase